VRAGAAHIANESQMNPSKVVMPRSGRTFEGVLVVEDAAE
jgi:hypothetical protein